MGAHVTSAGGDGVELGHSGGKLRTIDCIAQSLAVGPIFSAAVLGAILAGLSGGVGPFVILLTTVGILGLGVVVAAFATRYSGSGTVYEFVAHSLGKPAALFAAGAYHLAAISLYTGIPVVGAVFVKLFCSAHLGFDPPWWLVALLVLAFTIVVNLIGIQVSVRTQLTIIVASLVPFLILAVAIVADGGPGGNTMSVFDPSAVAAGGSIFNGLLFAILMFVGFELAAALGEETAEPARSIPVAIIVTIVIVAVFYVITQYVGTIGSGGPEAIPFDFAALGEVYVGRWLGILAELAVILDILAVGIGFAAATSRGLFTVARDGLLPRALAAVNTRDVPTTAAVTVGGAGLVVIVVGLLVYGTADVDGFPDAFNTFLVTSTIGAFVISVVYVLLAVGGIAYFSTRERRPPVIVAAVIGLATAGAGVAAQFIDATAPVGDARWGRHLGLVVLVVVAVWVAASVARRPAAIDAVGRRAVRHGVH